VTGFSFRGWALKGMKIPVKTGSHIYRPDKKKWKMPTFTSSLPDNLYLTGFMGAGKSTVGRELARLLGRRFVDTDERLVDEFGLPVPDIFARFGEEAFRQAETKLLKRLGRRSNLVMAVGGGLPVNPEHRRIMRTTGRIVHLDASLETCRNRLTAEAQATRPLWRDETAVTGLYERRQEVYADCDLMVPTDQLDPVETAAEILNRLAGLESFSVVLEGRSCPVRPTFHSARTLSGLVRGRRTVLVTDLNLARRHLARYHKHLTFDLEVVLPPGERTKTLAAAGRLYNTLLDAGFERGDLLIALGGGVITDLGAFVAATYKRGLAFILVSTSLVGCVDAAVGGKCGVNLGRTKNVIGCFAQPQAVILDLLALSSLGRRRIEEGLVEAYKTGLVAEPALADLVETDLKRLLAGDLLALAQAAETSARTKAEVVEADFREKGRRKILNFGHTFGHAVEGFHRFRVSHGRAVAAGMLVAVNLSQNRKLINQDSADLIRKTLLAVMKRVPPPPPVDRAWEIMKNDKKNRGGKIVFVLLAGPGRPVCVEDVTPVELTEAVKQMGVD